MTILPLESDAACACGNPATACGACIDKLVDAAKRGAADVKPLAVALRKRAMAYEGAAERQRDEPEDYQRQRGLADGLTQAADFLERGAW